MKFIIMFMFQFILLSCFLKQTEPSFNHSEEKYSGIVRVETYYGLGKGTFLNAYFEKSSEKKIHTKNLITVRNSCNLIEILRKNESRYEAKNMASSNFASVGKITLNTPLQSGIEELIEQADHSYYLELEDSFPSGTYSINSEILGELGYLVVPEELREVELNGSSLLNSTIIIKKNEPISAVWDGPVAQNGDYLIVFDLEINQENKKFLYRCVEFEKSLKNSTKFEWKVPTEKLSNFPQATSALIYFSRASIYEYEKTLFTVQIQGFRTFLGLAQIFE